MRAVPGDEFVPADDPVSATHCPRCAAAVGEDLSFRNRPHERGYRSFICEAHTRIRLDGKVTVEDFTSRDLHDGRTALATEPSGTSA